MNHSPKHIFHTSISSSVPTSPTLLQFVLLVGEFSLCLCSKFSIIFVGMDLMCNILGLFSVHAPCCCVFFSLHKFWLVVFLISEYTLVPYPGRIFKSKVCLMCLGFSIYFLVVMLYCLIFFYINFFGIIRKTFSLLPAISQACSEFRFITCWLLLWLFYISKSRVSVWFDCVSFEFLRGCSAELYGHDSGVHH